MTPRNFLAVLAGDAATAKGKVLETNEESKVFIFFTDHGASGLVAFPTKYLYASQLNDALKTMYKQNRYKKLVFYLEACEAGSMFELSELP